MGLVLICAISVRAQTASTSITGTIVAQESGLGISGATVELYRGAVVAATTTTNDAGAFMFPDIAPGEYRVTIRASGYTPTRIDSIVVVKGTATAVRNGQSVTLHAGAPKPPVPAATPRSVGPMRRAARVRWPRRRPFNITSIRFKSRTRVSSKRPTRLPSFRVSTSRAVRTPSATIRRSIFAAWARAKSGRSSTVIRSARSASTVPIISTTTTRPTACSTTST